MAKHLSRADNTDRLLRLLKDASPQGPPSRLRERLVHASEESWRPKRSVFRWKNRWTFAASLAALAAVVAVLGLRSHLVWPDVQTPGPQVMHPGVPALAQPLAAPSQLPAPSRPAVLAGVIPSPHPRRLKAPIETPRVPTVTDRLTIRLPYSNPEVSTGTSTMVRVSMPQSQLAALGLPLPVLAANVRIVADLTLGDDGLPRLISLPLPLQTVKEN